MALEKSIKDCLKTWVGFCHYRRFWVKDPKVLNFDDLKKYIKKIPDDWDRYEVILGNEYFVNKTKVSKIIKHEKTIIKKSICFFKKK